MAWAVLAAPGALATEPLNVTLAATERVPYLGEALPGGGYVAELVTEALRSQGYTVRLQFYPAARGLALLRRGEVDGLLPATEADAAPEQGLGASDAFPGDTVGLLKKTSTALPPGLATPGASLASALAALRQAGMRVGVVRGAAGEAGEGPEPADTAADDLQNLDKLERDRVSLLLIDKYTAADLITGRRPHLIGKLAFVPEVFQSRPFRVIFNTRTPQGRAQLAAFNAGLKQLRQGQGLARIQARHGLQPAPAVAPGEQRLVIGTVNNSDMLVMRQLAREFETAHPRVKLHWRVMDEGTLRTRLLSDLAIADGQFDVITLGAYEVPLWAQRGWLEPFGPLPAAYELDDLFPGVRAGLTHAGQLFALPFYAESSLTYYRTDLFRAAGLTLPAQPTWDDIATAAARLHRPEAGVYGICLRGRPGWGENLALITTMANAYGGRWFDERWRAELTSPPWHNAVTMYAQLLGRYGPPAPTQNGFNENLRLFALGRCAMWVDASVAAGTLYDPKRSQVAQQVAVTAAPRAVTDRGAAWLWSWSLAVPQSSSQRSVAQDFITWATSRGYIRSVARRYGWVAVPPGTRKSTYDSEEYRRVAPFHAAVRAALDGASVQARAPQHQYPGIQYVGIPEFPAIGSQVAVELAKVVSGQQTVPQALQRSQSLTTAAMAAAGYAPP
ncbi:extracellular solute-binding protein [Pelomonas puraquae]|uniref:Sugar ABC transporter substrate-binding protein n=2 Tax=Roseateles puraquae TaxID=431059 RepID=A0A254NDD5_9BURK|nr:extracellular solute-binding protein [Roseateles puraquae]OWR04892.1 sugar ABC transporter substrate-binding protein [Roseateles puraquae]